MVRLRPRRVKYFTMSSYHAHRERTCARISFVRSSTIFLLSPASLNGKRAEMLRSGRAKFEAAVKFREGGVEIAEAFSFMSALYFRGKIAYARHFARRASGEILVITSGEGLVEPEWKLDAARMKRLERVPIDSRSLAYRKPLENDVERIACDNVDATFVLLGSVASGKYVDVLEPILGDRLRFPGKFAGMGDMQRGALLLEAVRRDEELDYVGLDAPRSRARTAERKKKA